MIRDELKPWLERYLTAEKRLTFCGIPLSAMSREEVEAVAAFAYEEAERLRARIYRRVLDTDAGEQRMRDADEAAKRLQDERDA